MGVSVTDAEANPRELTKALAIYGAAAPAGGTAGVLLGGVLTEWLDWPWVFYINVPVGIAVMLATPRLLPGGRGERGRLDVTGALTVTAALSLAVFAIVRAPEDGWGSPQTVWGLVGSVALLGAFLGLQRTGRDPLLPLGIFRTPHLAGANVVMALLGAAWIPMWFFLNLYLQQVLGYGPFTAGSALLPMTLLMMVFMVGVTGRLVDRYGFRGVLASGMATLTVGLGILALIRPEGAFLSDVVVGVMTAVATSNGADQLTDVAALTDGFSSAFVGAGVVALVATGLALVLLRARRTGHATSTAAPDDRAPVTVD